MTLVHTSAEVRWFSDASMPSPWLRHVCRMPDWSWMSCYLSTLNEFFQP